MNFRTFSLFILIISFLPIFNAQAQKTRDNEQKTQYDPALYNAIEYRLVGPFRGGRSCTASGILTDDDTYYFGAVGGGVWKTEDGGDTYKNISDGYFGGSVGSIAVADSDPNIIYVGLGEKTVRGNVSSNFGMWKSQDAGVTWEMIGLENSFHIGRVRIHPTDPNIVYVAVMGNLWQPSKERGVYKTTDGGKTWNQILFANEDAGAVDLIIDPNNPRTLYASTWNVRRTKHNFSSGGPGSDLWKSTDEGVTWSKLTDLPNMPKEPRGIIGVSVSPVNSNRVYAIIEAKDGGVFRSDDAGKTWSKISRNRALRSRAWYYTRIYADTQNEDRVYVMNVSYGVSNDAGKTWELKNAPHGDHHDLWIDPHNNERMIIADDGGAQVSNDGGDNWTTYHNQPTSQFYRVATDDHFPYRIYGAQQDNSSIRILHRTDGNSITEDHWETTAGGESAYHAIDANDMDKVYGGNYKGYMYQYNHRTKQRRSINVWPLNPAGSGVEVMKYRFNWNTPVIFSKHEPNKLFTFSNHVHYTTTEGQNWQTVSPDLTRNDPETLKSSGGPITQDNTGVEFYANILTMMESPHEKGHWWTGSDDGMVYMTKDNCETWTEVTPKQAPKWIMWNSIDPHPTKKGGAYLAGTMYKSGDFRPFLYKTTDYGKTWQEITNGINNKHFTRVLRSDPNRAGLLYAGTEYGMYISFDDGKHWAPFQLNLPIVPITDLQVKNDNLVVGTQGRSFWIIDDLTPLHQINDEVAESDHYLYQPMPSYRMRSGGWGRANKLLVGQNHPGGVQIYYYFKDSPSEEETVKLEILEEDGTLIKSFTNKQKRNKIDTDPGMNLFNWNMRYEDATSFDGIVLYSSSTRGPTAVPGMYKARLIVGEEILEQEFEILKDPRVESSIEDLQAQFDFLIEVRDKLSEANQAVIDIRSIRKDLEYLKSKLNKEEHAEVLNAMDDLDDEMTIIENNIHETRNEARQDPLNFGIKLNNRLAYLATHEAAGDFRPTDQGIAYKEEVSKQIDAEIKSLNSALDTKLNKINAMLKKQNISFLPTRSPRS